MSTDPKPDPGSSPSSHPPSSPAQAPASSAAGSPASPTVNVNIDQKSYLVLMHASAAAICVLGPLCFMVPLVMWLMKKEGNPTIDEHGKAALNFQISVAIYALVAFVLLFVLVGWLLVPAVYILAIFGAVKGAIEASNGKLYKYPLSFRLVT